MIEYMTSLRDLPFWKHWLLPPKEKEIARKLAGVLDLQSAVSQQYDDLFEAGSLPLHIGGYGDGGAIYDEKCVFYNGRIDSRTKCPKPVTRVRTLITDETRKEAKKICGKWITEEKFRLTSYSDILKINQVVYLPKKSGTTTIELFANYTLRKNSVVSLDKINITCTDFFENVDQRWNMRSGGSRIDISGNKYERVISFDDFIPQAVHRVYACVHSDNLQLLIHRVSTSGDDVERSVQTELPISRNILRDLRGYYNQLKTYSKVA